MEAFRFPAFSWVDRKLSLSRISPAFRLMPF
jgi:hypothetical protein